jgi:hypothetical protein
MRVRGWKLKIRKELRRGMAERWIERADEF